MAWFRVQFMDTVFEKLHEFFLLQMRLDPPLFKWFITSLVYDIVKNVYCVCIPRVATKA